MSRRKGKTALLDDVPRAPKPGGEEHSPSLRCPESALDSFSGPGGSCR